MPKKFTEPLLSTVAQRRSPKKPPLGRPPHAIEGSRGFRPMRTPAEPFWSAREDSLSESDSGREARAEGGRPLSAGLFGGFPGGLLPDGTLPAGRLPAQPRDRWEQLEAEASKFALGVPSTAADGAFDGHQPDKAASRDPRQRHTAAAAMPGAPHSRETVALVDPQKIAAAAAAAVLGPRGTETAVPDGRGRIAAAAAVGDPDPGQQGGPLRGGTAGQGVAFSGAAAAASVDRQALIAQEWQLTHALTATQELIRSQVLLCFFY